MDLEKIILDNSQAIDLTVCGCLPLLGHTYFKRKRFDTRLQAENELLPGEIIAETQTAAFVLTPNHRHSVQTNPALVIPS